MASNSFSTCGTTAANDPSPCVLAAKHEGRHRDVAGFTWSLSHKHGRADVYEITWMSGHIETVLAHQITYPNQNTAMARLFDGVKTDTGAPRIRIHAEIEGRWCLTLEALEADIRTMRLVTQAEQIPEATS